VQEGFQRCQMKVVREHVNHAVEEVGLGNGVFAVHHLMGVDERMGMVGG